MKARTVGFAALGLVVLAFIGAAIGAVTAGDDEPSPKASASTAARSGAQMVVDAIAAKWPLPNPRDTSSGCKAKPGDTGKGCESRVTTDAVTVTEFADAQTAKTAAATLAKAGDARPAGRYVLSWAGDQDLTSKEARTDMATIAAGL